MMKIKTAELSGIQLDYAVSLIEGDVKYGVCDWRVQRRYCGKNSSEFQFRYHQSWAQAGPIIEREMITVGPAQHAGWESSAWPIDPNQLMWGDTPLEAAMRCYVASKLGDTVEIPQELR